MPLRLELSGDEISTMDTPKPLYVRTNLMHYQCHLECVRLKFARHSCVNMSDIVDQDNIPHNRTKSNYSNSRFYCAPLLFVSQVHAYSCISLSISSFDLELSFTKSFAQVMGPEGDSCRLCRGEALPTSRFAPDYFGHSLPCE